MASKNHHKLEMSTPSTKTAFIGLGKMGKHMAGTKSFMTPINMQSVCKRSPRISAWCGTAPRGTLPVMDGVTNCIFSKAQEHAKTFGTTFIEDVNEAAAADVIFACLPTTADVAKIVDEVCLCLG